MIIAADIHYGLSSDSVLVDGVASKIRWTALRVRFLIERAAGEKDRTLLIAGDIFDSHNPNPYILASFLDLLRYGEEMRVQIYLIPGNHDCGFDWSATDVIHSAGLAQTVVVTAPDVWATPAGDVLFVPHLTSWRDDGKLWDRLRFQAKEHRPILVVAHGQFSMKYEGGSEEVLEAGNAMVFNPVHLAKLAPYAFVGHIHTHQSLTLGKRVPIHIPGSLITNDFAEAGDRKGYYVYRVGKKPSFRVFSDAEWKYAVLDLDVRELEEPYDAILEKKLAANMLKLRLKVPEGAPVDRKGITRAIEKLGAHVCRVETEILRRRKRKTKAEGPPVHASLDHSTLLRGFLSRKHITTAEKTAAYRVGEEIIQKCLNT